MAGAAAASASAGNSVPFETSQPFLQRFVDTMKLSITDPVRLFSNMESGDIGRPLVYGVLVGTVAVVFSILWQMLFGGLAALAGGAADEFAISTGLLLVFLFLSPALVTAGLFLGAGLFHLGLLLVGGGRRGFPITFRAVCYGYTPNVLAIVPFCGGVIGGIWGLVLTIMGAVYGHETDAWRGILGYFLPAIVCCVLALVVGGMFGLLGALVN
jgi:hypothetical protein